MQEAVNAAQDPKEAAKRRVERIRRYEALLNRAERVLSAYERALSVYARAQERFSAVQEDIRILNEYYGGKTWWEDFDACEAGELPADLPCGVLTEDGVWDLLERNRELIRETEARLSAFTRDKDAPESP